MSITIGEQKMGPFNMGFFPYEQGSGKLSGAIVHEKGTNQAKKAHWSI